MTGTDTRCGHWHVSAGNNGGWWCDACGTPFRPAGAALDAARTENPTEKVPTPPDALREAAQAVVDAWASYPVGPLAETITALRAALEADR